MSEYISIRTSTLRGDQKINFDLFIYMPMRDKYILYIRKGDSFEGNRLQNLKDKKLKKLFITPDAEEHYRQYLNNNLKAAYDDSSNKSVEERSEIVQGHQESNAEMVIEDPSSEANYNLAKDGIGKFFDFLEKYPDSAGKVFAIENIDKGLAHHGVTVATLTRTVCQNIGMDNPESNKELMLGALIHDLGLAHILVSSQKHYEQMDSQEKLIYETHPTVGVSFAKESNHFDPNVIHIIKQHEELLDGSGYPEKLHDNKIDGLALIVGMCSQFNKRSYLLNENPADIMKNMMIHYVGKYPLPNLQALQKALKHHGII